jgi:hypothetical protein
VGGRGRPDGRAPPVSVQRKRKKKGAAVGSAGEGELGRVGHLRAGARKDRPTALLASV